MFKTKTLDVWDTLVRRCCHPEFLKLGTARHVFLHSGIELKESYASFWDIYKIRVEVEANLASEALALGHDNEYEISNVLRRWLEEISIAGFDSNLPNYLADIELCAEMRCTYPDPSIREFLKNYPSHKTIFLSDFYMGSESLKKLLEHHGLSDIVSEGFSSCDVMLNKRSGNLFKHIHKQFDISPNEHIHIGDSMHSDVEMPRRLGIQAFHYEPAVEHSKRQMVASFFTDRGALMRHIEKEVANCSGPIQSALETSTLSAFLLGERMAPLFVGFSLFIAESAVRNGLGKLFFFTREGEFFAKVWQALFTHSDLVGHKLPEVEILEVSRFSTFCASLQDISIAEIMRLWSLYRVHSFDSLLASLGLTTGELCEVLLRHGIDPKESIKHPWNDARVQNLFQDSEFIESIQAKILHDRPQLLDYLNQKGLNSETRKAGIVDIGWRGSIQDNLCCLLPDCQISGFYLGLQKYLNKQPANSKKQAYGPNANLSNDFVDLLNPVSVIEMLCSSEAGSVKKYQRNPDRRMESVRFQEAESSEEGLIFSKNFQSGVLQACTVWSKYINTHVITSDELRVPACSLWRVLISEPNRHLAMAYSKLKQNDVFGAGVFVDKNFVPSCYDIFLAIFDVKKRRMLINFICQTQWPAGIMARIDMSLHHRLLVAGILSIAKIYKNQKYKKSRNPQ